MVDLNDPITLQILWNRLISITDQADAALGRAAFSPVVREGHDYVTVLLDAEGNSLAQCSYSIPSFISTLPITARHALKAFPPERLSPGDILITNDPWLGTGHLPDITMLTPVYRGGNLVAFAGCVAHMPDIGGRSLSAAAQDLHEEGIRIPILKLFKQGQPVEEVFGIIQASVRVPEEVLGDLQGMVAANQVMEKHLIAFMEEYGISDLTALAQAIHGRCESAMRRAIQALPKGTYTGSVTMDGMDEDVILKATVTIGESDIHVDFSGTSPQSPWGINVVPAYRSAFTAYIFKCLLDPNTPNSEGCFRPITTFAPEGCILNPRLPAAVGGRNLIGHGVASAVLKALYDVLPDRVQADSGSTPTWWLSARGTRENGERYATIQFIHGGMGARPQLDGADTLCFPSNAYCLPVESLEAAVPLLVEEKALIPDSGGPGRQRGGLGQRSVFRNISGLPVHLAFGSDRIKHPPLGIDGGLPGRPGYVALLPGDVPVSGKSQFSLPPGQALVVETPGGGGYGDPAQRAPELVAQDLRRGVVSADAARTVFGYKA